MQKRSTSSAFTHQETGKQDIAWIFLAEYTPGELIRLEEAGDEPVAGERRLEPGRSQEYPPQFNRILAELARQAMWNAHSSALAVIRLFCQDKMLKGGNQADALPARPIAAGPGIIRQTGSNITGGWGYFLVEKSADSSGNPLNQIDLYLYKEGE